MSDVSQGDGWWRASDGKWYAPEQHPDYKPAPPPPPDAPPPTASAAAPTGEYSIFEDGKNGTVHFEPQRLVRRVKKLVGKDDVQTIPIRAITAVSIDRKMVGKPVVTLTTSGDRYEWKMAKGEEFKAQLDNAMYDA